MIIIKNKYHYQNYITIRNGNWEDVSELHIVSFLLIDQI